MDKQHTDYRPVIIFAILTLLLCWRCGYLSPSSLGVSVINDETSPIPQQIIPLTPLPLPQGYRGKLAYQYDGNIFILDLETGEHRRYRGVRNMTDPDWHISGEWLVFGYVQVYRLDISTGQITRLDGEMQNNSNPTTNPVGNEVVFVHNQHPQRQLYYLDLLTGLTTILPIATGDSYIINPAYSPNGIQIAFTMRDENRVGQINLISTTCLHEPICQPIQLTDTSSESNFEPTWSPDGTQLAFTSKRDGKWEIYVMNADGSNQRRLTYSADNIVGSFEPSWSPDGQYIAFSRNDGGNRNRHIYIMRTDGSEITRITPGLEPDWWMDPATLAAESTEVP